MDYDIITVGAGHNGLIASAYLAQAGYRVAVFERRPVVGGAIATEERIPGYQIDLGGSAHILIRLTPIVEELGLSSFGLSYIDLDPLFFAPFPDGNAFYIYRDVDETAQHLENEYPGEGYAYRRFIDEWSDFAASMRDLFLAVPSPLQLGKKMLLGGSPGLPWKDALRFIMQPYGDVARAYFQEPKVQAALTWMAAQSGPPPTEPLTGPFLLWHPLYHEGGIARPRGGSGMLAQALRRHIEHHGGAVFTDAPVEEILVKDRAAGVRVDQAIYTARGVLAATHVRETFDHLLPATYRPTAADHLRVGNGFGAMLRLALSEPVRYAGHDDAQARTGLQLLCRNIDQIQSAYGEYLQGRPASDPPLVAMTFSAVDDSLAPPGGEVLWLWGQYFPYELAEDDWDSIGDAVAERFIETFERYAPGTREKIVDRIFQHPLWLERELGLYRGNIMHLEMSLDQMFGLRPAAGLACYRGPVKGLYLTGASTHPGGGIMGASGRNAARVLLKDLESRTI